MHNCEVLGSSSFDTLAVPCHLLVARIGLKVRKEANTDISLSRSRRVAQDESVIPTHGPRTVHRSICGRDQSYMEHPCGDVTSICSEQETNVMSAGVEY